MKGDLYLKEFRVEYVADRAQTAATAFPRYDHGMQRAATIINTTLFRKKIISKLLHSLIILTKPAFIRFSQNAVPSPSMPILNAQERTLANKKWLLIMLKTNSLNSCCRKTQRAQFLQWKKTWDNKVESLWLEWADFTFDDIKIYTQSN